MKDLIKEINECKERGEMHDDVDLVSEIINTLIQTNICIDIDKSKDPESEDHPIDELTHSILHIDTHQSGLDLKALFDQTAKYSSLHFLFIL